MIDIHTHVLPEVDDGCPTSDMALSLLKKNIELGADKIILTPHLRREFNLSGDELRNRFEEFLSLVKKENLNARLFLGQELFYNEGLLTKVQRGEALTLAGGEYVLLEFSYFDRTDVAEAVYRFVRAGYKPIVAHVERCEYLDINDWIEIKDLGGEFQVNASSVMEKRGSVRKTVSRLFKERLVDYVASDIHYFRTNYLEKAYAVVKKKYGAETAEKVFCLNAKKIIQ